MLDLHVVDRVVSVKVGIMAPLVKFEKIILEHIVGPYAEAAQKTGNGKA